MKKTWMPTAAGILDIIAGAFALIGTFGLIIGSSQERMNHWFSLLNTHSRGIAG